MKPKDYVNKFVRIKDDVMLLSELDDSFVTLNENDIVLITKVVAKNETSFRLKLINSDGKPCYDVVYTTFFDLLDVIPDK